MKKILIIYPHFPPSNLAGVHRPRLFAEHLKQFGWEPVILTVDEKYYEEKLDWNLHKLLSKDLRIEKVKAFKITKPRLIGDIGLRSFFQIRKKALSLLRSEHFDFIYIPIPSFYMAILGPYLFKKTKVQYGIDYIDPWVHQFPGSEIKFSRHWFSTLLAKKLEPLAVKNASLITGVAAGYYEGVIKRNPLLKKTCLFGSMPYGGEERDYRLLKELAINPYLFNKNEKVKLVYAGAMLPNAYLPLEAIFKSIASNISVFENIEFHFIGTGKYANDPNSYNIKPLAEKYNLWEKIVFEYPARIPYLDVLVHLSIADGVFILGSTEPHYTPSKCYQGILSEKLILAILHSKSSAVEVLNKSNAGIILSFDGINEIKIIETEFITHFLKWHNAYKLFTPNQVNKSYFDQFSAKKITAELARLLNLIIPDPVVNKLI